MAAHDSSSSPFQSHHPFMCAEKYRIFLPGRRLPHSLCAAPLHGYKPSANSSGRLRQPWSRAATLFVLTSDHQQVSHDEYKGDIGTFSAPSSSTTSGGEIKPGVVTPWPTNRHHAHGHWAIWAAASYLSFGCDLLTTPPAGGNTRAELHQWSINTQIWLPLLQFDGKADQRTLCLDQPCDGA